MSGAAEMSELLDKTLAGKLGTRERNALLAENPLR
jgi:hypothetical protein